MIRISVYFLWPFSSGVLTYSHQGHNLKGGGDTTSFLKLDTPLLLGKKLGHAVIYNIMKIRNCENYFQLLTIVLISGWYFGSSWKVSTCVHGSGILRPGCGRYLCFSIQCYFPCYWSHPYTGCILLLCSLRYDWVQVLSVLYVRQNYTYWFNTLLCIYTIILQSYFFELLIWNQWL